MVVAARLQRGAGRRAERRGVEVVVAQARPSRAGPAWASATGPPNVLGTPKPMSSISTITTLGAPAGALTSWCGALRLPHVELRVARRRRQLDREHGAIERGTSRLRPGRLAVERCCKDDRSPRDSDPRAKDVPGRRRALHRASSAGASLRLTRWRRYRLLVRRPLAARTCGGGRKKAPTLLDAAGGARKSCRKLRRRMEPTTGVEPVTC